MGKYPPLAWCMCLPDTGMGRQKPLSRLAHRGCSAGGPSLPCACVKDSKALSELLSAHGRQKPAPSQQIWPACSPSHLTPMPWPGSFRWPRALGCLLVASGFEGTCLLLFQPLISLAVSRPRPPSGVPSHVPSAESSLRPTPPPTPPVTPC